MKTYVLYHANCADGFGAAMAARLKLFDDAEYLPVKYGQRPPDMAPGAEVYILDFSYPREELEQLGGVMSKVVVLDHHKTAKEALADFVGPDPDPANPRKVTARFDMNRSGAVLAWEYFHIGKPVPSLLHYVQDRDLWTWALPESRAVSAGLRTIPTAFDAWALYMENVEGLAAIGRPVLAYQDELIGALVNDARPQIIGTVPCQVVNTHVLISEVCERLLVLHPGFGAAACYFDRKDGTREYSLRSRNGSSVDVSAVAKEFGGGGHKHAAGFTRPSGE